MGAQRKVGSLEANQLFFGAEGTGMSLAWRKEGWEKEDHFFQTLQGMSYRQWNESIRELALADYTERNQVSGWLRILKDISLIQDLKKKKINSTSTTVVKPFDAVGESLLIKDDPAKML